MRFIYLIVFCLIYIFQLSNAQTYCLGHNCPQKEAVELNAPELSASDREWQRYALWQGLTAGFHIANKSVEACLKHCGKHAKQAEAVCRSLTPYNGFKTCDAVFSTVYTTCAEECTRLPH
mgnify:CR=1 FL=1